MNEMLSARPADSRRSGKDASAGPPMRLVHATEPVARALAGRRWMPIWAVIRHRGRKSGTAYETPIAIVPTIDAAIVMIGLPWGVNTNWARNVVAAGGASLRWKARDVELVHPRIVDAAVAQRLAKAPFRRVLGRFPAAIVLDRAAPPVE
ncbi:nitroreductase family deazaflavin-dependent oxidoreductase [Agromyces sp. S2-1-8]|uniref:nitroreductase family deazaflavin-dependent oxidoreductase n=1 Tax=unclassified Agromyces TaxID=2639701 RepID=UPI001E5416A7|nr:nitroreductase family deazaflavin-dependent oxidoreductase [Agromyces sp. S2-1-8]MCD5348130.1 nitroreductase family deazaflavin-dependent oxidoreductase [Agromyces sp. S2-1-8]